MKEFKVEVIYYNKNVERSVRSYEFENESDAQVKYSKWNKLLESEKKNGNVIAYKVLLYKVMWGIEEA